MPATPRKSFRLTESDLEVITRLGKLWGSPHKILEATEVVRVATRKCLQAEATTSPGRKIQRNPK